ncbi:MAG: hypothetical protein MJE63_21545 [Proteobacteria bacterium]|nr:hypothetical protein [Pseudomonadota bacterium]
MLKYSCTNARLANWVLRHVNEQPGLIFPCRKGWEVNVKLIYPGDQNKVYFNVVVTNQTELLSFIPVNNTAEVSHLKCLSHDKSIRQLKKELGVEFNSYQLIFMTCEKHQEAVTSLLSQAIGNYNLLMLDYEKMSFVKGSFKNPRLEFRLSSQNFDTDLIPNLLPESQHSIMDGINNSLFYQNIFYNLNAFWLSGEKRVGLRSVLKKAIPYWKHYRKKDQQEIIEKIGEGLEQVFHKYTFEGFQISKEGKKSESVPVTTVVFPKVPEGRKELNNWSRKLEAALDYFRDEVNQISIDSLEFKS